MVWLEHVDDQSWKDARIYAAQHGAQPQLIDDMARYTELLMFPELTLDGSDLYWSVPELAGGAWHGRLLHRNLASLQTDVVEESEGKVYTAPSAAGGTIAYEVATRLEGAPMFVRVRSRGALMDIAAPSSEPAIGDGFVVFKHGNRFESATIESVALTTRQAVIFGHGEAPRADRALAVWFDNNMNEGIVGRPADGCVATSTSNRGRTDGVALVSVAVGGSRLGWTGIANVGGAIREFVRTSAVERMSC